MSVRKINGFAAPYRSRTFQEQAHAGAGRNGVLSIEDRVSTDLTGNVVIPPIKFIQDGLIVSKDVSHVLPMPAMPAPFYLTVSAATSSATDDLTFKYARSPLDIVESSVIIAEYDGNEWRTAPSVSVDGVYDYVDIANVDLKNVGPQWGLYTREESGAYKNYGGVLIDSEGVRQKFDCDATFPVIPEDPDFSRVDRVVYRRPGDYYNRIGVRKFLLGDTFEVASEASNVASTYQDLFGSSCTVGKVKVVASPLADNCIHILAATTVNGQCRLSYLKLSSSRTLLVAPKVLSDLDSGSFDACVDLYGKVWVSLIEGNAVKALSLMPSGDLSLSKTAVSVTPICKNPAVRTNLSGERIVFMYQAARGAGVSHIYFRVMSNQGQMITAEKQITSLSTMHERPDFCITDDEWVYATWEDSTLRKISYRVLDEVGDPLTSETVVSGGTLRDGVVNTLVHMASSPRIMVGDNKTPVIAFLQDNESGTGVSLWSEGSAHMPTVPVTGQGQTFVFSHFDVHLSHIYNTPHFLLYGPSGAMHVQIKDGKSVTSRELSSSPTAEGSLTKDYLGSLYHIAVNAVSEQATVVFGAASVSWLGPQTEINGLALNLSSSEFIVSKTASADFDRGPVTGDRVDLHYAGGSLATAALIEEVLEVSTIAGRTDTDSYKIRLSAAIPQGVATGTISSTFKTYAPNTAAGFKTSATTEKLAYEDSSLATDTLLSRIVVPDGPVLDWVPKGAAGLPLDLYAPYGAQVSMDWSATLPGAVTLGSGLRVLSLIDNVNFTVTAGSFPMAEGTALLVTLDKDESTTVMPWTVDVEDIPWSLPVLVLGFVKEGEFAPHALANMGLGTLDAGESVTIGQDLSNNIRARLGITGESTFQAYTSTEVVALTDTYPEAISKLDVGVETILRNNPKEQSFDADGVTSQFVLTDFAFSADATYLDITVWVDGRKQEQSLNGQLVNNYRKLGVNTIQFAVAPVAGSRVTVRKEGTSTAGLYREDESLWGKAVDDDVSGPDLVYDFGNQSSRWATGHFGEVLANQITLPSSLGHIQQLKAKENGDAAPLVAGKVVALGGDGKIYHAESDVSLGQKQIGIVLSTAAPGASAPVLLFGYNVPGVLTGLGFTPGDEVFVSEVGTYVNANATFLAGDNVIARVGWADSAAGVNGDSVEGTDLIINYQKIVTV
jgi:hypothetical protein